MHRTPRVLAISDGKIGPLAVLEDLLASSGWELSRERSVSEALVLLVARPFDLVLTGVKMDRGERNLFLTVQARAGSSLFFAMARGSWWLPAVLLGRTCVNPGAVSYEAFIENVECLRRELERAYRTSGHKGTLSVALRVGGRRPPLSETDDTLLLQV